MICAVCKQSILDDQLHHEPPFAPESYYTHSLASDCVRATEAAVARKCVAELEARLGTAAEISEDDDTYGDPQYWMDEASRLETENARLRMLLGDVVCICESGECAQCKEREAALSAAPVAEPHCECGRSGYEWGGDPEKMPHFCSDCGKRIQWLDSAAEPKEASCPQKS